MAVIKQTLVKVWLSFALQSILGLSQPFQDINPNIPWPAESSLLCGHEEGSWSTPEPFLTPGQKGHFLGLLHLRAVLFSLISLSNKPAQSQAPESLSKPGIFPASPGSVSHCPQSFPGHGACPGLAVPLSCLNPKVRKVLVELELNACTGQVSCGDSWEWCWMFLGVSFFRDFNVNAIPTVLQCTYPITLNSKLLSRELLNCKISRKHQQRNGMKEQIFCLFRKRGGKFNHHIYLLLRNFPASREKYDFYNPLFKGFSAKTQRFVQAHIFLLFRYPDTCKLGINISAVYT